MPTEKMYYISEFCCACLKKDTALVVVSQEQTETDSLANKLKLCISEVEWSAMEILLCEPCIEKLNNAFEFKVECLKSARVLQSYVVQLTKSCRIPSSISISLSRNEVKQEIVDDYLDIATTEEEARKVLLKVKSNSHLFPQVNENSIPNIFVNFVPTAAYDKNLLLNLVPIDSRFPFVPQIPPQPPPLPISNEVNASQVLTSSCSEEVSVEVDPACFDCNDWDDLISPAKIPSTKNDGWADLKMPPIDDESLMDLLNIDHFMASKTGKAKCEQCGQLCDSVKSLHFHTNNIHKGKFPYSCKECLTVFVQNSEYKSHIRKYHKTGNDFTLKDLSSEVLQPPPQIIITPKIIHHPCPNCPKMLSSKQALERHNLKHHKPKKVKAERKKYFIKGMKNAKCEICEREFSTQSYLQQHIKLHERRNTSRRKVWNSNTYKKEENTKKICTETEESPSKGIKITINLKNIKKNSKPGCFNGGESGEILNGDQPDVGSGR